MCFTKHREFSGTQKLQSQVFTSCIEGEYSLISPLDKYFFLLCNFNSEWNQRFFLDKWHLEWQVTSEALSSLNCSQVAISCLLIFVILQGRKFGCSWKDGVG